MLCLLLIAQYHRYKSNYCVFVIGCNGAENGVSGDTELLEPAALFNESDDGNGPNGEEMLVLVAPIPFITCESSYDTFPAVSVVEKQIL